MKTSVFLVVAMLCAAACAERVFIERDTAIPVHSEWTLKAYEASAVELAAERELIVALWGRNADVVEERFWRVSNPKDAMYKEYMTTEEITALVHPGKDVHESVRAAFAAYGVTDVRFSESGRYAFAKAPLSTWAAVFDVHFSVYEHETGVTVPATMGPYSLDASLADSVAFVSYLTGLPTSVVTTPTLRGAAAASPSEDVAITPTVLRNAYNVSSNTVVSNTTLVHAVAEFQAQYFKHTDLVKFFDKFVPYSSDTKVQKIIGVNKDQPGLEASLDIQYLMGVAPGANANAAGPQSWFYSMAEFNFWSDLTKFQAEILDEKEWADLISISYGSQGDYPSASYRQHHDQSYQQMGLRGQSIVYASGDSGAGCNGVCSTLYPSYPATSVYVTSVGATRFVHGNSGTEAAVKAFGSGGGFSELFDQPSYQSTAVNAYLNSGVALPEEKSWNAKGRGTPDVAAAGAEHFQVYDGGSITPVGGTSCAAPTFSAVISLINDRLLNAGDKPLGFLNQWLYQNPDMFTDITIGNNECGQSGNKDHPCGFLTHQGWDPVTGLGTPNFGDMAKAAGVPL